MTKGIGRLLIALIAMSLVFGLGSVVYADQTCPTRWGEPVGIDCERPAAPVSLTVVEVEDTGAYASECATRWGEPVGIGCRTATNVVMVAGEAAETGPEYIINCPTRWGEPIGTNCRVPVDR